MILKESVSTVNRTNQSLCGSMGLHGKLFDILERISAEEDPSDFDAVANSCYSLLNCLLSGHGPTIDKITATPIYMNLMSEHTSFPSFGATKVLQSIAETPRSFSKLSLKSVLNMKQAIVKGDADVLQVMQLLLDFLPSEECVTDAIQNHSDELTLIREVQGMVSTVIQDVPKVREFLVCADLSLSLADCTNNYNLCVIRILARCMYGNDPLWKHFLAHFKSFKATQLQRIVERVDRMHFGYRSRVRVVEPWLHFVLSLSSRHLNKSLGKDGRSAIAVDNDDDEHDDGKLNEMLASILQADKLIFASHSVEPATTTASIEYAESKHSYDDSTDTWTFVKLKVGSPPPSDLRVKIAFSVMSSTERNYDWVRILRMPPATAEGHTKFRLTDKQSLNLEHTHDSGVVTTLPANAIITVSETRRYHDNKEDVDCKHPDHYLRAKVVSTSPGNESNQEGWVSIKPTLCTLCDTEGLDWDMRWHAADFSGDNWPGVRCDPLVIFEDSFIVQFHSDGSNSSGWGWKLGAALCTPEEFPQYQCTQTVYDRLGQNITSRIFESKHNYDSHTNHYETVTSFDESLPGLLVAFDPRSTTDSSSVVRFYKDDRHQEYWGNSQYSGQMWPGCGEVPPLFIPSKSFVLHFASSEASAWGFRIRVISSADPFFDELQARGFSLVELKKAPNDPAGPFKALLTADDFALLDTRGDLGYSGCAALAEGRNCRLPTLAEVRDAIAKGGNEPLFDQDMWWPVSDAPDTWISVGNYEPWTRLGNTHNELFGVPHWNEDSTFLDERTVIAAVSLSPCAKSPSTLTTLTSYCRGRSLSSLPNRPYPVSGWSSVSSQVTGFDGLVERLRLIGGTAGKSRFFMFESGHPANGPAFSHKVKIEAKKVAIFFDPQTTFSYVQVASVGWRDGNRKLGGPFLLNECARSEQGPRIASLPTFPNSPAIVASGTFRVHLVNTKTVSNWFDALADDSDGTSTRPQGYGYRFVCFDAELLPSLFADEVLLAGDSEVTVVDTRESGFERICQIEVGAAMVRDGRRAAPEPLRVGARYSDDDATAMETLVGDFSGSDDDLAAELQRVLRSESGSGSGEASSTAEGDDELDDEAAHDDIPASEYDHEDSDSNDSSKYGMFRRKKREKTREPAMGVNPMQRSSYRAITDDDDDDDVDGVNGAIGRSGVTRGGYGNVDDHVSELDDLSNDDNDSSRAEVEATVSSPSVTRLWVLERLLFKRSEKFTDYEFPLTIPGSTFNSAGKAFDALLVAIKPMNVIPSDRTVALWRSPADGVGGALLTLDSTGSCSWPGLMNPQLVDGTDFVVKHSLPLGVPGQSFMMAVKRVMKPKDVFDEYMQQDGMYRIVESATHPYSSNLDEDKVIHIPGATSLSIWFDPRTETEQNYDFIQFKGEGQTIYGEAKYSGGYNGRDKNFPIVGASSQPLLIPADTVKMTFHSDGSNEGWGYRFIVYDTNRYKAASAGSDGSPASDFDRFKENDLLFSYFRNSSKDVQTVAIDMPCVESAYFEFVINTRQSKLSYVQLGCIQPGAKIVHTTSSTFMDERTGASVCLGLGGSPGSCCIDAVEGKDVSAQRYLNGKRENPFVGNVNFRKGSVVGVFMHKKMNAEGMQIDFFHNDVPMGNSIEFDYCSPMCPAFSFTPGQSVSVNLGQRKFLYTPHSHEKEAMIKLMKENSVLKNYSVQRSVDDVFLLWSELFSVWGHCTPTTAPFVFEDRKTSEAVKYGAHLLDLHMRFNVNKGDEKPAVKPVEVVVEHLIRTEMVKHGSLAHSHQHFYNHRRVSVMKTVGKKSRAAIVHDDSLLSLQLTTSLALPVVPSVLGQFMKRKIAQLGMQYPHTADEKQQADNRIWPFPVASRILRYNQPDEVALKTWLRIPTNLPDGKVSGST